MEIKLNFINESNDQNNSEVVFFQKNVGTSIDELAIAWTVIKNCATGWHHPFVYPLENHISAKDSWGNELCSPMAIQNGQLFHVYKDPSGDQLAYVGPAASGKDVELRNDLTKGAITAEIYKAGKLLAVKSGVSPAEKAVFQFKPTLWVGVVSQIEEGQLMNSAIISDINTEISLLGIKSADIVMTGGGIGPKATPFVFELTNIVHE